MAGYIYNACHAHGRSLTTRSSRSRFREHPSGVLRVAVISRWLLPEGGCGSQTLWLSSPRPYSPPLRTVHCQAPVHEVLFKAKAQRAWTVKHSATKPEPRGTQNAPRMPHSARTWPPQPGHFPVFPSYTHIHCAIDFIYRHRSSNSFGRSPPTN